MRVVAASVLFVIMSSVASAQDSASDVVRQRQEAALMLKAASARAIANKTTYADRLQQAAESKKADQAEAKARAYAKNHRSAIVAKKVQARKAAKASAKKPKKYPGATGALIGDFFSVHLF